MDTAMAFIITKYAHFLGILLLFSSCLLEYQRIKPILTRAEVKRLIHVDIVFGLSALLVLMSGLAMALWLAKPLDYYLNNWIFHFKYSLFIIIGLISAYPTVFFFRNRRGNDADAIDLPSGVKTVIKLELTGILCLPLLGILIAAGFGVIK
jgi:putative membrane protein